MSTSVFLWVSPIFFPGLYIMSKPKFLDFILALGTIEWFIDWPIVSTQKQPGKIWPPKEWNQLQNADNLNNWDYLWNEDDLKTKATTVE